MSPSVVFLQSVATYSSLLQTYLGHSTFDAFHCSLLFPHW